MTTEVQWSQLQRDPKSVAALADQGEVRVWRRDGVPLLLLREETVESATVGAVSAARALRNALVHLPGERGVEVLVEEFPWVDVLPEVDQRRFVSDFVRGVAASAELGRWALLAQVVQEWKASAAVHADPTLVSELTGSLDVAVGTDFGVVPPPDGT